MKSISELFTDMFMSGATYKPEDNSFQVKPENMAMLQMLDQQRQETRNFFDDMNDKDDIWG